MAANLMLHAGAREVTIDELARVETPTPTPTWFPIPHVAVLEAVEEQISATGYAIRNRRLALGRGGNQFFGTLDLFTTVGTGVSLAVGIRNSIDKTLPLGFCAGNRVFVCDNLSFSAELLVNRKHTINGSVRFREAIALASGRLGAFREAESNRIDRMHHAAITEERAESLILRAYENQIISTRQLPVVLQEWRQPSHDEFGPRTAWSLFNAFTEALKPLSRSNPQAFAGRTFDLNRLLVPPTEGPADIEAAFREIQIELADQEASEADADTVII